MAKRNAHIASTLKVPAEGTVVEQARRCETNGDWAGAATLWSRQLEEQNEPSADQYANTIEYAFACVAAFQRDGLIDPSTHPDIRRIVDTIKSRSIASERFFLPRHVIFKGFDLLAKYSPSHIPAFLIASGADPDTDDELRDKILNDYMRLSPSHTWVWEYNITQQRLNTFNNVIVDFANRHNTTHSLTCYFRLKLYAAQCLVDCTTPDIREIFHIACADNHSSFSLNNVVFSSVSKLSGFLDHTALDIASSIAFHHPVILANLARQSRDADSFADGLTKLSHLVPRYCVITKLGYPMGGGESFMHQTCRLLREFGFHNTWVSFTDGFGARNNQRNLVNTPYYVDIRENADLTEDALNSVLHDYGADLVHTQGEINPLVSRCCERARIPCLVGFHFWNGIVDLGVTRNSRILSNKHFHRANELVPDGPGLTKYLASEFMADVLTAVGGRGDYKILHPVPDPSHYLVDTSSLEADHVVQINLATGKGGGVFLQCVQALEASGVPFLGVHSEAVDDGLLDDIRAALDKCPGSRLESYGPAKDIYSRARLVVVPTQVDETFCRVAFEAAANGIPVISTRAGYIPYMLEDTGYYLAEDDPAAWTAAIRELYFDKERLRQLGLRQKQHVLSKYGSYPKAFLDEVLTIANSQLTRKSVGLFTSWNDQGLGYQARHYAKLLRNAGFRTHVFSFLPYSAINRGLKNQSCAADWSVPEHADSVYYSYNTREHVKSTEIEQFVAANNIGVLLYPEICWDVNWNTIAQISMANLFVLGVPNLEIVRRGEALNHQRYLFRTLCPTRAVEHILYAHGVQNIHYIGHGFGTPLAPEFLRKKIDTLTERDTIRFLHVGGHNPRTRKRTPDVISAFLMAAPLRPDIHLTVCIMDAQGEPFEKHPQIEYLYGSVGHDDILNLYERCDVSIQVSSHEGVGMGFYESLSRGTPIISLNVPPHNEVVVHGLTGWLLEASLVPLPDNDDPVSRAAQFNPRTLAKLILGLGKGEIAAAIASSARVHEQRFCDSILLRRMIEALP